MRRMRVLLVLTLALALSGVMPAAAVVTSKIESVVFVDANNGYMSGGYLDAGDRVGFVSRTSDGGATWNGWSARYRWMYGVDALTAGSAWTVSDYFDQAWRTTNGGTSWSLSSTLRNAPQTASMSPAEVAQLSADTVVVAGTQYSSSPSGDDLATVWRSTDGGVSWSERWSGPQDSDPLTAAQTHFDAVDASSDGQLLVAVGGGRDGTVNSTTGEVTWLGNKPRAAYSIDGGASWSQPILPELTVTLEDVAVVSSTTAWAVGSNQVIKTSDGGASWQSLTPTGITMFDANAIATRGSARIAMVGVTGKLAVSVDGGSTWKSVTTVVTDALNSVSWRDDTHLVVVGDNQWVALIELNADGTYKSSSKFQTTKGSYGTGADVTNPVISVTGVTNGATYYSSVKPVFSVTDNADPNPKVIAKLNGATFTSGTTVSALGTYQLVITAEDASGNSATKTATFYIKKRPTTLSLSAPSTSTYASARLTGYLKSGTSGVAGRYVEIQQYVGGIWQTIGTTTAATTSTGFFSYTAKPTAKATYRARFAGDGTYESDYSASDSVLPKVKLTRSTSWSTLYRNKTYTAKGSIAPYHATTNANKVTIRAYKKWSDGKYHYSKSFTATYGASDPAGSSTPYAAKVTLTTTGTWKLVAYHATDSTNYKTYGSADYVTVK